MTVLWSLLVAVGLSLHIFVIMMKTGATQTGIGKKQMWKIAAVFAGIQLLLQCLGAAITWGMEQFKNISFLHYLYKFIIFAILAEISLRRLYTALKKEELFHERREAYLTLKKAAFISARTGGIAIVLGMNMYYCYCLPTALPLIAISLITAVAGFAYGYWNGVMGEKIFSALSGGLMAFLAASMVLTT